MNPHPAHLLFGLCHTSIMPTNPEYPDTPAGRFALSTTVTSLSITVLSNDIAALWVQLDRVRNSPQAFAHAWPQVIVALATLQHSVQDLSRAYIQHANTVLAPGKQGLTPIDSNLTNILTESGLLTGRPAEAAPAPVEPEVDGKKKRKRTPHDPNAPKRALTPYFLYMQSARATIAKELGDSAKPKEVADEGTRRWTEMSPGEKSVSPSPKFRLIFNY
jgi:hypothetical protein